MNKHGTQNRFTLCNKCISGFGYQMIEKAEGQNRKQVVNIKWYQMRIHVVTMQSTTLCQTLTGNSVFSIISIASIEVTRATEVYV